MAMLFAAVHESEIVKVCGCRPQEGGAARTGAGVRKPPMEMLWGGGEEIVSIVADMTDGDPQCKSRTT